MPLTRLAALAFAAGVAGGGACARERAAPAAGRWRAMALAGAPAAATNLAVVWTGAEMIVWGGAGPCTVLGVCGEGARYQPAADRWRPMSAVGAPAARALASAVWTGAEMIVWGGRGCGSPTGPCADGAVYDPARDVWTPLPAAGQPEARVLPSAVWTGREMLLWGGVSPGTGELLSDGAAYHVANRTWRPLSSRGAPGPRRDHLTVWTGKEMIVWGGASAASPGRALADGARYDPAADAWRALGREGAPPGRWAPSAIWTGSELVVWGGVGCGADANGEVLLCGDGARYDPGADRFRPLSAASAPTARAGHTAVWTGTEMIVWAGAAARCGDGRSGACADGARYNPASDRWESLSRAGEVVARTDHLAVWTGAAMLVWGGLGGGESEAPLAGGAIYGP